MSRATLLIVAVLAAVSLTLPWESEAGTGSTYLPGPSYGYVFNSLTGYYEYQYQYNPGIIVPGSPGRVLAGTQSDARVWVPLAVGALVLAYRRRSRRAGRVGIALMVVALARFGSGGWQTGTLVFAVATAVAVVGGWAWLSGRDRDRLAGSAPAPSPS